MPSTCVIYPQVRVRQANGTYKEVAGTPISYNGSQSIPCRLDVARFFRSGDAENQPVVINDFELHLPFGLSLQGDYRIQIDGEIYEIRKMMDKASNSVTQILLVTRLENIAKALS